MHDLPLITTIAAAFTAAWLLGLLTQRLGLSPIVGYLLAGVLIDNKASLALHEGVGFRRVGVQMGMGQDPRGRWRDVVLIERRSPAVLPVRQDWAQQPHAETQPNPAGGHGHGPADLVGHEQSVDLPALTFLLQRVGWRRRARPRPLARQQH